MRQPVSTLANLDQSESSEFITASLDQSELTKSTVVSHDLSQVTLIYIDLP